MDMKPLEGIIVADLTRVLAGPWCTRILSDLGARIIKVEDPENGDGTRGFGTLLKKKESQDESTRSAYFAQPNCGNESIALDLKDAKDKDILDKLLMKADVLIENFRPGVMKKLGYDWPSVHSRFPKLIMCSISGFGQTGPLSQKKAVDTIIQSMSGILEQTGSPDEQNGVKAGPSISDLLAGIYAANGVQAALLRRLRTGVSSYVDISMLDCSVASACESMGQYFITGYNSPRMRNAHGIIAPFDVYQCGPSTTGKPTSICIAGGSKKHFKIVCKLLNLEWVLEDSRFLKNKDRLTNATELRYILEDALKTKTSQEWFDIISDAGVPCGPVLNVGDAASHPQTQSRHMMIPTADGRFKVAGNPIKISEMADLSVRPNPPKLDGDREAILRFINSRI